MGQHMRKDNTIDTSKFKIVYIAPMKALVAEMVGNFSARVEPYNMRVRELTGDMNLTKSEIDETQVQYYTILRSNISPFSLLHVISICCVFSKFAVIVPLRAYY